MARKNSSVKVVRANLRLDAEAYRRLLIFSVMESRSAGDIVSDLLREHLKGWSMPGKVAVRGTKEESANLDGRDTNSEPIAA